MHQAHAQILFGMRYADMPWLAGVSKYMMTSFHSAQHPPIRFKLPDDLLTMHGGYCNHHKGIVNTRKMGAAQSELIIPIWKSV